MQINAVKTAPQIEIVARMLDRSEVLKTRTVPKRIKPYPPNFRRIPAKSIEPTTGASTWAFGNHR